LSLGARVSGARLRSRNPRNVQVIAPVWFLRRTILNITQVRTNRHKRGGNRLPPDRYRERGPAYERVDEFGPDPERRDRTQREVTRRAVDLAVRRGELPAGEATLLYQMMEASNDRLIDDGGQGVACTGWWSLAALRRMIPDGLVSEEDLASEAGVVDEAGMKNRGARTAGRKMSNLRRWGWLDVIHRKPSVVNGEVQWTSNLWRIKIPDHLRLELRGAQDVKRARRSADRRGPGRAQPPKGGRPDDARSKTQAAAVAIMARNDAIRANPCPACGGGGWIYNEEGKAEQRCPFCKGDGHLSGAGP
jgi:hypothetical protein